MNTNALPIRATPKTNLFGVTDYTLNWNKDYPFIHGPAAELLKPIIPKAQGSISAEVIVRTRNIEYVRRQIGYLIDYCIRKTFSYLKESLEDLKNQDRSDTSKVRDVLVKFESIIEGRLDARGRGYMSHLVATTRRALNAIDEFRAEQDEYRRALAAHTAPPPSTAAQHQTRHLADGSYPENSSREAASGYPP